MKKKKTKIHERQMIAKSKLRVADSNSLLLESAEEAPASDTDSSL